MSGVKPIFAMTPPLVQHLLGQVALLMAVTLMGLHWYNQLGLGALSMLFQLCVLAAAVLAGLRLALFSALAAVLLINYYFIAPTHTFQIDSIQSWLLLLAFALVAVFASAIIQQLKQQRLQAMQAAAAAHCLQSLSSVCAAQVSTTALLEAGLRQLAQSLANNVTLLQLKADGKLAVLASHAADGATSEGVVPPDCTANSVQWVLDFERPLGAGTTDWPEYAITLWPFSQIANPTHALPAAHLPTSTSQPRLALLLQGPPPALPLQVVRLAVQQLALAYYKLLAQLAQQQAEQQFQHAQFKKTILAALSHDMRTPLTAIAGSAQVLARHGSALSDTVGQQLLDTIQTEVADLLQATENILTLVKLESDQQPLRLDWQSPADIIQHVCQRVQARAPEVTIQVQLVDTEEGGERLLYVDAFLVAHALTNVLENALHWREPNTPVRLEMQATASQLCLSVSNQGPGFPPDWTSRNAVQRDRVATPLAGLIRQQVPADGQRGHGLGLHIVQQIMLAHGGSMTVQDHKLTTAQGYLTTVSLCFPHRSAALKTQTMSHPSPEFGTRV